MKSHLFFESLEHETLAMTFGWLRFVVFIEVILPGEKKVDLNYILSGGVEHRSLITELRMWRLIMEICQNILGSYPTSI